MCKNFGVVGWWRNTTSVDENSKGMELDLRGWILDWICTIGAKGGVNWRAPNTTTRGTAEICAKIFGGGTEGGREGDRSEAVACHHNFCAQEVAKRGEGRGPFRFDDANAKTAIELLPHPHPLLQCHNANFLLNLFLYCDFRIGLWCTKNGQKYVK